MIIHYTIIQGQIVIMIFVLGGWGKPPVDESGKPLYGDVFGTSDQKNFPTQAPEEVLNPFNIMCYFIDDS